MGVVGELSSNRKLIGCIRRRAFTTPVYGFHRPVSRWHLRCGGRGAMASTLWSHPHGPPAAAALALGLRGRLRSGVVGLQPLAAFRAAPHPALASDWPQGTQRPNRFPNERAGKLLQGAQRLPPSGQVRPFTTPRREPEPAPPSGRTGWPAGLGHCLCLVPLIDSPGGVVTAFGRRIRHCCCARATAGRSGRCWPK